MMKWKPVLVLLSLGLLSAACHKNETARPGTETVARQEAKWLTDFDPAQSEARTENKMLLINFTGSDWCPPCIMLHRQILSQPEFAEYAAKNLVLLEIDFPHTKEQSAALKAANEKLAERYGIYGFPTVIVLDFSGKKVGELGYMPGGPEAFIAELEKLRPRS
ncbi:MAG: thioredoxin family protein [Chthoniobacterales bacterium]|nr:thioredoxin family protein [Chthoniobacterales bacterium]